MRLTRRTLLKGAAAVGSGMALQKLTEMSGIFPAEAAASVGAGPDPTLTAESPAVLYDLTRCVGCHMCEVACQVNKGLTPDKELLTFKKPYPEKYPDEAAWAVRRHQCMHCINPACVSVCPVAAMYKTPEGPVIYRDERCLGCRYCMNACPFGVPRFDWNSGIADKAIIRKCNFCYERQQQGKLPACVEACPAQAVIFGKRGELLAEAKKRIAQNPGKYVDHIYGETEAGGTGFLLLSGIPFDTLGLPDPPHRPLTTLSETVMKGTIPFALSWAAVLTGLTALIRLRSRGTGGKEGAK